MLKHFWKCCSYLDIQWLGLLRYFWKYCINRKWFGSLNLLCGASPILLCPAHCPRSAILDICEWFFIRIHTDFVFVFVFMNGPQYYSYRLCTCICEWFFIRIHTDFVFVFVFVFMNGSFSILIKTLYLYLLMVLHQNLYRPFVVSCSRKEGG